MDKDQKNPAPVVQPMDTPVHDSDMQELLRKLKPDMRRPKPGPDEIAAAMEAAQRLAAEVDAEDAADDLAREFTRDSGSVVCSICGHRNRAGNKFCGMCGIAVGETQKPGLRIPEHGESEPSAAIALPGRSFPSVEGRPAAAGPTGYETHHYHHHYHHHYFPGAPEGALPRASGDVARDPVREVAREERMRPTAALRGEMSRAEAAVRRITHEWVLACNTKHLDDLLDLYVSDALVLRSNYPPIRGAAAVREFFFGALDAGLGEVELEPLRVEVVGDLAYEAGRCKALVPGAAGKRREERGKYLWVCARQSNGEWMLAADCWSSDLALTTLESDLPASPAVKTNQPRKNP